jgi:UDP-3-O-[3-hydroxymyristoyl] glucosamine N-acyltransferase
VLTLGELAERLGARVSGDVDCRIERVATLDSGGAGEIAFLANPKYRQFLSESKVAAVIVTEDDVAEVATNALIVPNPHVAYARVAAWLHPEESHSPGVHPGAVVDANSQIDPAAWIGPNTVVEAGAQIAAGCQIGPGCVIGRGVMLGEGCRLVANVTLCHGTRVGARAILHPGVVLGADGFGLANEAGQWLKVPQVGRVVLGDDVEVGANTTIDRGALEDTIIGKGVKLDNLIQIAHNVHIGDHTAIAACTGVAGSTRIGKHCAIGGGVGIVGHLEIADNVTITAMSYVSQPIPKSGVYSSGTPLEENAKWHRNFVRQKQLDDMARRLKRLEKQLDQMTPSGGNG